MTAIKTKLSSSSGRMFADGYLPKNRRRRTILSVNIHYCWILTETKPIFNLLFKCKWQ